MRKAVFVCLIFLSISGLKAQTVDEIIAFTMKNNEILSDGKAFETIGNARLNSGQEMYIHNIQQNKKLFYQEIRMKSPDSMFIRQYYDTKAGWNAIYLNKVLIQSEKVEEKELNEKIKSLDATSDFYDYKNRGIHLTFEGIDSLNHLPVYKIKAVRKDGLTNFYYFDTITHYQLKMENVLSDGTVTYVIASNFKRHSSGIILPYTIQTNDMTMELSEINFISILDSPLFEMPKIVRSRSKFIK